MIGAVPRECIDILAAQTGYVQHIDMEALQSSAEGLDTQIYVRCPPGSFASCGEVLLSLEAFSITASQEDAMRRTITINSCRTFEDDPRFGLIVLTEIASKALSPAVNDPGTAISILGRLVRILSYHIGVNARTLMFVFNGFLFPPLGHVISWRMPSDQSVGTEHHLLKCKLDCIKLYCHSLKSHRWFLHSPPRRCHVMRLNGLKRHLF